MPKNRRAGRGRGIHVRTRRKWAIERMEAAISDELASLEHRRAALEAISGSAPSDLLVLMFEHTAEVERVIKGISIYLTAYEVNSNAHIPSL